jgi:hypothetical protein
MPRSLTLVRARGALPLRPIEYAIREVVAYDEDTMSTSRKPPLTADGSTRDPDLRRVPPRRPSRWRREIVWASGLNMLVGVWLVVSPSVLDYRPEDSAWNPVVCGAIVTVLAAIRVAVAWAASVLSWISALIGAWLFVSAFTLAESEQAAWNVGIGGVVVFSLAVWSASATEGRRTVV